MDFEQLESVVRAALSRKCLGEEGVIQPVNVWSAVELDVLGLASEDLVTDQLKWIMKRCLDSSVPHLALLFFDAYREVLEGRDPRLLTGEYRSAVEGDVRPFLGASVTDEEWEVAKSVIARGGFRSYEVQPTNVFDEPVFAKEPLKLIPICLDKVWAAYAKFDGILEPASVRFLLSDECLSENAIDPLIALGEAYPNDVLVLITYSADPVTAEALGRMWAAKEINVVLYTVNSSPSIESKIKMNMVADTCYITGSKMGSYVIQRGVEHYTPGCPEVSQPFPNVSLRSSMIRFPAHSTAKNCRIRAGQLLKMAEENRHYDAESLKARASYINGAEVLLYLPEDSPIKAEAIDLIVSVYRVFMDNAILWKGRSFPDMAVPLELGVLAVRLAEDMRAHVEQVAYTVTLPEPSKR